MKGIQNKYKKYEVEDVSSFQISNIKIRNTFTPKELILSIFTTKSVSVSTVREARAVHASLFGGVSSALHLLKSVVSHSNSFIGCPFLLKASDGGSFGM